MSNMLQSNQNAMASGQMIVRRLRPVFAFLTIVIVLIAVWEGYKALGAATGNKVPFTGRVNRPLPLHV